MASNQIYQQAEKVAKNIVNWHRAEWPNIFNLVKQKGEVEKIGERDFRVPAETHQGGRPGKMDSNAGDMGRGSSPTGVVMTSTFEEFRLNFEISNRQVEAVNNTGVGENPLKTALSGAIPQFVNLMDSLLHNPDGEIILAVASAHTTSGGKSIYTVDTTQRVFRGQYVSVYNTSGTLLATNCFVEDIFDYSTTLQIKLNITVPGAGATDEIALEGGSPSAVTGGLTGIYSVNNTATTGTFQGVARASESRTISTMVDGSALSLMDGLMALFSRLWKRTRDANVAKNMVALVPIEQQVRLFTDLLNLQRIDLAKVNEYVDRLPQFQGMTTFPLGNFRGILDPKQTNTRIDVFDPKNTGRAVLKEMDFWTPPGSTQKFLPLYGGSGGPNAAVWFGLWTSQNVYWRAPYAQGALYSLSLPTGI